MPPKLYLVRHAQGEHNATRNYTLRDPPLTQKGKLQCQNVRSTFTHHDTVELVLASPLRRTIQTAGLCFGPALARPEVPFLLVPVLQEVSDLGCDRGIADSPEDVAKFLPEIFEKGELEFDLKKVDASLLTEGWNSKTGYWAYTKEAISKRASDLRSFLFQRPETEIIVVTHGAFLHFLTEDWDVSDPMTSTAWNNCEAREFVFTSESSMEEAHLTETPLSRATRGKNRKEDDPHVIDEMKTVETY